MKATGDHNGTDALVGPLCIQHRGSTIFFGTKSSFSGVPSAISATLLSKIWQWLCQPPPVFRLYCSFSPNVVKVYASTNHSRPPCLLWRIPRMILTFVDYEWRQGHVEFRYVSHCCSDWGRISQNQICIRPDLKRSRAFCSSRCGKYHDLVPKIRLWPLGTVV